MTNKKYKDREKYKFMKGLVMFDLPMTTKGQQKQYRIFRKELLRLGFTMMQYSIYMRTFQNGESAKRVVPKIKKIAPKDGNVRFLLVTERQYEDMEMIKGEKTKQEQISKSRRFIMV